MKVDIYIWILPATDTESTSHGMGNGMFGKEQTVVTPLGPSQTVEGDGEKHGATSRGVERRTIQHSGPGTCNDQADRPGNPQVPSKAWKRSGRGCMGLACFGLGLSRAAGGLALPRVRQVEAAETVVSGNGLVEGAPSHRLTSKDKTLDGPKA